jgi:DNA-binding MarR family transcriptional regulator
MQSYFGPRTTKAVISAIDTLSASGKTHFNYSDIAEASEYSLRSVNAVLSYLIDKDGVQKERVYTNKRGAHYRYTLNRPNLVEMGVLRDST